MIKKNNVLYMIDGYTQYNHHLIKWTSNFKHKYKQTATIQTDKQYVTVSVISSHHLFFLSYWGELVSARAARLSHALFTFGLRIFDCVYSQVFCFKFWNRFVWPLEGALSEDIITTNNIIYYNKAISASLHTVLSITKMCGTWNCFFIVRLLCDFTTSDLHTDTDAGRQCYQP